MENNCKSRRWRSPNENNSFSNGSDFIKQRFSSASSHSPSPINRTGRFNKSMSTSRSPKLLYSSDEEEELSASLKVYYDHDLNELLETSFDGKSFNFNVRGAKLPTPEMMFTEEKWTVSTILLLIYRVFRPSFLIVAIVFVFRVISY